MNTCADLRLDLALLAQGGDVDDRAALETHVAGCAACAAELTTLRAVLGLVRRETEIEPSAAETAAIFAAVDAELDAEAEAAGQGLAPVHEHGAWRQLWGRALWRYENSDRFRRVTIASIGVHAAAAAAIGWMLLSGSDRARDPRFDVQYGEDVADLRDQNPLDALVDELGRKHRAQPDEPLFAGEPRPFREWSPEGVALPPIYDANGMKGRSERLRAPTVGILLHLRAAMDDDDRARRVSDRVGETLAPRADTAVGNGLDWLAGRRAADGRWGPVPADGAEDVRDGVTAAVVLAFAQNGRSACDGSVADVLGPAVEALENRLRDGAAAGDAKPIYSHALAVRALTWQWAVDYRHLDPAARASRRALLLSAGQALVDWQDESGGYGYTPGADRPDASCTIFVAGAMADLRLAGVLRADETLRRAGAFLGGLRADDGAQAYREIGDRKGDLALTAGLLAHARELRVEGDLRPLIGAVQSALADSKDADALLAWQGLAALRRQRDVGPALAGLLDRQRENGSWPSATDRHCRLGGDDLTTAMGVLAVTRVYVP